MSRKVSLKKEKHLEFFGKMVRIRKFEQKSEELFMRGELPGFLHSYIGEEAAAVGVCGALQTGDYITTTHRGHGHVIAKGADVNFMMAELFGKATGYCMGKGGSMHIFSRELGILGANGIVGGGIPIATGAGLTAKIKGASTVCVSFFGDGASDEGSFHESLNLASIYKLPVLYVCENNMYAESQRQDRHQNIIDVAQRASAYGMDSAIADGTDVLDVYGKTLSAVAKLRNGQGPFLLELKLYRWSGHYIGDPAAYRPKDEPQAWRENRDPIKLYQDYILSNNIADSGELDEISERELRRIDEAVEFSRNSDYPDSGTALEDVYA